MSDAMMKFNFRPRGIIILLMSFAFVLSSCWPVFAGGDAILKRVVFRKNYGELRLVLTGKRPSKVIKISNNEILIALKNVVVGKNFRLWTRKGTIIKDITIEHLSGQVLALIVDCSRLSGHINSYWHKSAPVFIVYLGKKDTIIRKPITRKASLAKTVKYKGRSKKQTHVDRNKIYGKTGNSLKASVVNKEAEESKNDALPISSEALPVEKNVLSVSAIGNIYIPHNRKKTIFAGDVSDILIKADISKCSSNVLNKSVKLLRSKLYKKGFDLLDNYIKTINGPCEEQAYFLRAYAYMKSVGNTANMRLIKATRFFQEALVKFPDSKLKPFAFASLGLIHWILGNTAIAEGFFNLVAETYGNYPGMPEVIYFLGKIYGDQGYDEKALVYFKRVFEDMPENSYVIDAGIGVGKELFKEKQYINSLRILSYIVKENPERIYKSAELLLVMGNGNFELGRGKDARQSLSMALNFFPDIPSKDMIMTRIGETYAMDKNFDRAKRIFKFVMKEFPGGEGYVKSAMDLAKYLKDRAEKEKIYNMIKKDFSDNPMAGIAMMRLAELYNHYGEYSKCIEEIENFLATHPRHLRYDAVKLMQKAYESLFNKQLKSGDYPKILKRYESKQAFIDRLDSKKIALLVGLAYEKAHLNEQAFNQLIKAYKLYPRMSRPPELLFDLGVVMDDSGRKDDALKVLKGFVKRFPKNVNAAEAWLRIGNILLSQNKPYKALDSFSMAYKSSGDHIQKGKILEREAEAYKLLKNWQKVVFMFKKALNDFSLAQGKNYQLISSAYRSLGDAYMKQKEFVNAGDAFSMALKFSGKNSDRADLGFMMGDAYEKANIIKKAKQAFEDVASGDDSIWARLAKDRLSTLKLAKLAKNS